LTYLIITSFFVVLIFLAFWLTYRQGKHQLAYWTAGILSPLVILSLVTELGYLTSFLMILLFAFLIIFVSYWTLINLGFKKAGKIVATVFTVLALLPLLSLALEDYFFFRSDARKMLKENQIELKDDFKITSNKITGLNDLYQKFELQISKSDKDLIIQQLRHSPHFKNSGNEGYNLQSKVGSGLTKKIYRDYEKEDFVRREAYQKLRTGYKPDYDIITISKVDNKLTFERINE
jgi:hypothetical protein